MYWNVTDKERLIEAFAFLAGNPDLMEKFLTEIFTEKEVKICERKLKAMCMLVDLATYKNVGQVTKLSPNTIAQLSKTVNDRDSAFNKVIRKFKKQGPTYFD